MTAPIRVALADDEVLFCDGISMLIESQDDLEFVGAAYNGVDIVQLVADSTPDIVLMDIRMPGADGITATRSILRSGAVSTPRVIVLTTHQRDTAVLEAIDAGASGFLMKDATADFLLASIRTVHAGKSVMAPATSVALIRDLVGGAPVGRDESVIAMLSPRETELFRLAARGLSNTEIAEAVFISESTVKSHISNILAKMGLSSRLQLVALAYEYKLLD